MIVIHNEIDNEIQDRYMIRGKRQERTVVKKTLKNRPLLRDAVY